MSNKADENKLNSLHLMTAEAIAKLLEEAKGDPDMMLRVLREARGFLKDNNITASIGPATPLQIVQEKVDVAALPFEVEEEE